MYRITLTPIGTGNVQTNTSSPCSHQHYKVALVLVEFVNQLLTRGYVSIAIKPCKLPALLTGEPFDYVLETERTM